MTVKKLIKELSKYPEDMVVYMLVSYDEGFGYAGGTIQYIEKEDVIYLCNDEN